MKTAPNQVLQQTLAELERIKIKYDLIVSAARKDYNHCYNEDNFNDAYQRGYCHGAKQISKRIIDIDSL